MLISATPEATAHSREAFTQGLRELRQVEGQTYTLEARYAGSRADRLPELARELVHLKVDVIVVSTDLAAAAAKQQTRTIPIVMTSVTDPVGAGFVTSLARPGGNVTGLTNLSPQLSGKRLELVREAVPGLSRVAFLWNPDVRGALLIFKQTEGSARSLGLEFLSVEVTRTEDLERAFSVIAEQRAQALVVSGPNPIAYSNQGAVVKFAQKARLPAVYAAREFVDAGGLMSYGPAQQDLFRRAATYVDKILKGAKPGDLPVEQPTKFELVINLKTAKALGLTIPPSLLQRADQVIE